MPQSSERSDDFSVACDLLSPLSLRVLRAIAECDRGISRTEIARMIGELQRLGTIQNILASFRRSRILCVEKRPRSKGLDCNIYTLNPDKQQWQLGRNYADAIRRFDLEYNPQDGCPWRDLVSKVPRVPAHLATLTPYQDRAVPLGVQILRFLRDAAMPLELGAIRAGCGNRSATSATLAGLIACKAVTRLKEAGCRNQRYTLNPDKQVWADSPPKALLIFDQEYQPDNRRYGSIPLPQPIALIALSVLSYAAACGDAGFTLRDLKTGLGLSARTFIQAKYVATVAAHHGVLSRSEVSASASDRSTYAYTFTLPEQWKLQGCPSWLEEFALKALSPEAAAARLKIASTGVGLLDELVVQMDEEALSPEQLLQEPALVTGESIEQLRQQRLWLAIALHQLGVAYVRQCGNPKAGFYDWLHVSTLRWLTTTTAAASLSAEAWVLKRCRLTLQGK